MKFSVQTDRFEMLQEILKSDCDKVRFGSDFCEWKIPNLELLKKAYSLIHEGGKGFVYVTPRLSNSSFRRVKEQLAFLNNSGEVEVVINDLGPLNVLNEYPNLKPRLGRRLVFTPARCPWLDETLKFRAAFLERRRLEEIYYQTSLNYAPTIHFYQKYGIRGADVDWIPRCFPYLDFLIKKGLSISVHLHLIQVTVTRRCHTARFLGEEDPWSCSRPCNTRVFLLKQPTLKLEFYLHGNAVFRLTPPSPNDVKRLRKQGIEELIIALSPITKIESKDEINSLIQELGKS